MEDTAQFAKEQKGDFIVPNCLLLFQVTIMNQWEDSSGCSVELLKELVRVMYL